MRLRSLAFVALLVLTISSLSRPSNAVPTAEIDLASTTAWTFRPSMPASEPKVLAVPAGGWRLNGFPAANSGTYERRINVPKIAGGDDQVTLISFEAVNWEATVFAGPDSAHLQKAGVHLSAWTPFRVDISRFVTPGKAAVLRVDVRDRTFFRDAGGKFTVPAATEWNDRQARGIIRGVSLQVYPAIYINDVFVRPNTSTGRLGCDVTLTNASRMPRKVSLKALLMASNATAKWKYPTLPNLDGAALAPGQSITVSLGSFVWSPGRASWWWPNVPYRPEFRPVLHRLRLQLWDGAAPGKGTPLQTEVVRFGFCTPGQRGSSYTLNGIRLNLRGDSLPEGTLGTDAFARMPGFLPPTKTSGGWPQTVHNYQRLNYNVIRMHQVPCTRYMMDVCDELGMLVIPETAIRGGGDHSSNVSVMPDAFVKHLRELILRDRNHPSVVKWSLENELFGSPEEFIKKLYSAATDMDPTRPSSIDDNAEYPNWPDFAEISHYSQAAGAPDAAGGKARTDRPFGQGEFVWPFGAKPQGPLWFALTTRALREHDNADIRPYTLLDVWPGVVSGLTPGSFPDPHLPPDSLEQGGRSLLDPSDPWSDPSLKLMQRSFAPVAVFDRDFDRANTPSDGRGEWATYWPRLTAGKSTTRSLVIFNDEFTGESLQLKVSLTLYPSRQVARPLSTRVRTIHVPLGGHVAFPMTIVAPEVAQNTLLEMTLTVIKEGKERYQEKIPLLILPVIGGTEAEFLSRDDKTQGNWVGKYGSEAFLVPIKGGRSTFQIPSLLLQRGTGEVTFVANPFDESLTEQEAEIDLDTAAVLEDVRLPMHGPGVPLREPTAFSSSDRKPLILRINSTDGKAHRLSLYLLDFNRESQSADVAVFDLAGHRLDTRTIDKYGEGSYICYRFTNTVLLAIWPLTKPQMTISGVFVDADYAGSK